MGFKFFFLFLLLTQLLACSSQYKKDDYLGVELGGEQSSETDPQIDIRPIPQMPEGRSSSARHTPVVGLYLLPDGNRTWLQIGALKALKRHKIPIHLYTGMGPSLVLSAYMAKKMSPNQIEWKLFKLAQRGHRQGSIRWRKDFLELFLRPLNNLGLEEYPTTLYRPIYQGPKGHQSVQYTNRGKFPKEVFFTPPSQETDLNIEFFFKKGVDILVILGPSEIPLSKETNGTYPGLLVFKATPPYKANMESLLDYGERWGEELASKIQEAMDSFHKD